MKLSTFCRTPGSPLFRLFSLGLMVALLGLIQLQQVQALNEEWIYDQPRVPIPILEGGTGIGIDFQFGASQTPDSKIKVIWYKDGKVFLEGSADAIATGVAIVGRQLFYTWSPSLGVRGDDLTLDDGERVLFRASIRVTEPGLYYAKVIEEELQTNVVQVAVVPANPQLALQVTRSPENRYKEDPSANPSFSLSVDMLSHVRGTMDTPHGLAMDGKGCTYVADSLNHVIRRITPGGHMTTVAGMDGYASRPYIMSPTDFPSGNAPITGPTTFFSTRPPVKGPLPPMYVLAQTTDQTENGYRSATGRETNSLFDDEKIKDEPRFDTPMAIAVSDISEYSSDRVLYVSDTWNNTIRVLRTEGSTTSVSNLLQFALAARPDPLQAPRGLVFSGSSVDPSNPPCLYVVDGGAYMIKKIHLTTGGSLDTTKGDPDPDTGARTGIENIAGRGITPGWQSGPSAVPDLELYKPRGLAVDTLTTPGSPILYVADSVNHVILEIKQIDGVWTAQVVVGFVGERGNVNGVGQDARLYFPMGLAIDEERHLLYFTEFGNHSVKRVLLPGNSVPKTGPQSPPDWKVDLVAGSGQYGPRARGETGNGIGSAAQFFYPSGICINKDYKDPTLDHANNTYLHVADSNNHVIRRIKIPIGSQPGEGVGESSTIAGVVGFAHNRDYSELEEFTYQWKSDGVRLSAGSSALGGIVDGVSQDELTVRSAKYQDAGVYGVEVTSTVTNEFVEAGPGFVYINVEGKRPRFLKPGYKVESLTQPVGPVNRIEQGSDVVLTADIIPADNVTYQWWVAEDKPDEDGKYKWVSLSRGNGSNWAPVAGLDPVIAAQRAELTRLLGSSNETIVEFSYLDGVPHKRLTIRKIQASFTASEPLNLRFKVEAFTRFDPTLTGSTKVPVDTVMDTVSTVATWTVSSYQTIFASDATGLAEGMTLTGFGIPSGTRITRINGNTLTVDTPASQDSPSLISLETDGDPKLAFTGSWTAVSEQTLSLRSTEGLSVGMNLTGPGIRAGTKIKAIQPDPLNPQLKQLVVDRPAEQARTNAMIYGAVDLFNGVSRPAQFGVQLADRGLSVALNTAASRRFSPGESHPAVLATETLVLSLAAGAAQIRGVPAPSFQWYKSSTAAGAGVAISGATSPTYTATGAQLDKEVSYFYVVISNTLSTSVASIRSDSVGLLRYEPGQKPTVSITDISTATGTTDQLGQAPELIVDKTKSLSPLLRMRANIKTSSQPTYTWTYTPDDQSFPARPLAQAGGGLGNYTQNDNATFGELTFSSFSDDADGVFTLTVTVPGFEGPPPTCRWHVTVRYLPQYIPQSRVFQVGTLGVTQDAYTVDLSSGSSLRMGALFKSPRSLPLPTYRWRRNNFVLPQTTNFLEIPKISKADVGVYSLEVTNQVGTFVYGPAVISSMGWTLSASGKPSIVVQPNGKLLTSPNPNVSAAMAGMVAAPPRASMSTSGVLSGTNIQRVARGQRLALQVGVDADPPVAFQWERAALTDRTFQPVLNAKTAIYVLPAATELPGTRWRYRLVATNSYGSVTSDEVVVQVEGLPDPVVSGTVSANANWKPADPFPTGSRVILSANVSDPLAQYTYQWRFNGNAIVGATSKELVFPSIQPSQAGAYSVVATGLAGSKESGRYAVAITQASTAPKYTVTMNGDQGLRMLFVNPTLTEGGFAPGTRVSMTAIAQPNKMLQCWRLSYTNGDGQSVMYSLPARAGSFVMPAADVFVEPVLSRLLTGHYSGFLSLDAPWPLAEGQEWTSEADLFRPVGMEPGVGSVRAFFTCTVSSLGAVSGQIQLENRTYGFATVLDNELRANFRILATLKGVPWAMNGTLAFNATEENRQQGDVDNVVHVVLRDALMATPPEVQAGQTLYGSAVGISGATESLRAEVVEQISCCGADVEAPTLANPLQFTAAVYRESGGETKPTSFGQAAVLSVLVRQSMGTAIVQGYLANGTRVTFSTYLGRAFITPQMEGPDVLQIYPGTAAAKPFKPQAQTLSGQAYEALSETLLRRSSSQTLPLWFRGDAATEPVYGTMLFNGPRVYGSLGALNWNSVTKRSDYTPNLLAGYFYDPTEPHLANLPANQFVANQTTVTAKTPTDGSSYSTGLKVSWPTATFTPPPDTVLATVDRTTGLLFGGMLESTTNYVRVASPAYSPDFAGFKPFLACTAAAVIIQRPDILPGFSWTTNPLGGYVGFIYRGRNAKLEPCKTVLGSETPKPATLDLKVTPRIEPFLIDIVDQF